MTTIEERLAAQLDAKDEEIAKLEAEVGELEEKLRGSATAWSMPKEIQDDPALPLPRLEMVWTRQSEHELTVEYRLVAAHLLGHVVAHPFGSTRISGSGTICRDKTGAPGLPFRDGAHAAHDGTHLGLPLYLIVEGERAVAFTDWENYKTQSEFGAKHRRDARGAS